MDPTLPILERSTKEDFADDFYDGLFLKKGYIWFRAGWFFLLCIHVSSTSVADKLCAGSREPQQEVGGIKAGLLQPLQWSACLLLVCRVSSCFAPQTKHTRIRSAGDWVSASVWVKGLCPGTVQSLFLPVPLRALFRCIDATIGAFIQNNLNKMCLKYLNNLVIYNFSKYFLSWNNILNNSLY